jgi:hypothetical protein
LVDAQRNLVATAQPGARVVGEDAAALRFLAGERGAALIFELSREPGVRVEAPRVRIE